MDGCGVRIKIHDERLCLTIAMINVNQHRRRLRKTKMEGFV